jgi:hypothetical protein
MAAGGIQGAGGECRAVPGADAAAVLEFAAIDSRIIGHCRRRRACASKVAQSANTMVVEAQQSTERMFIRGAPSWNDVV